MSETPNLEALRKKASNRKTGDLRKPGQVVQAMCNKDFGQRTEIVRARDVEILRWAVRKIQFSDPINRCELQRLADMIERGEDGPAPSCAHVFVDLSPAPDRCERCGDPKP